MRRLGRCAVSSVAEPIAARCKVCGVHIAPGTGGVLAAGGRILFVTCDEHTQLARDGLSLVGRVAAKGLSAYARHRAPTLFGFLEQAWRVRQNLRGNAA
jgi:hypothetical protein